MFFPLFLELHNKVLVFNLSTKIYPPQRDTAVKVMKLEMVKTENVTKKVT
jgi:hypothetical protein